MELRDYQQEAVDTLFNYWDKSHKPCIVQASTGAGKSVICAEIARRTHAPVLVLQPTKEILEQNYQKFIDIGFPRDNLFVCSASAGGWEIGGITLATIGTIYKHAQYCQHFQTVIIDECDVVNLDKASGMYMSFLRQLPAEVKIVGLTASPWRNVTHKKLGCDPEIFCRPLTRIPLTGKKVTERFGTWFWAGGVIYKVDIPYLQSRGFLSPTQYYVAQTDWSFLPLSPSRVDYDTQEMSKWVEFEANTSRFHQAVKFCFDEGWKTIVFSPNIEVSDRLAGIIQSAGAEVATLDSENDNKKTREAKMAWFRQSGCKFLVNVGMVGRGVDVPSVDAIIMARPTKSLSLYVQAVGRCLRIDPNNPDKVAQIIDLAGNLERFGKVEHITLGKEKCVTEWGKEYQKDVINISLNGRKRVWEKVS